MADLTRTRRDRRKRDVFTHLGVFIAEHLLAIVLILAVCAFGGLGYSAYAANQAASAQHATLDLTKRQGDQIKALEQTNKTLSEQNLAIQKLQESANTETQRQLANEAKLLCGGFVPLSKFALVDATSPVGVAILNWARNASTQLNCAELYPSS